VASGEVGLSLISLGSALNFVKGGKAKALAITRATRHPSFPEWPTVKESGVPNFAESIWIGLAAPTGTPREIVNRLSTEVGRALRSNELRERLAAMGSEPVGTTPDEAAARIRREIARYTPVIKQAGIRAE
jgi:tripartite-type tricarboxylate transporter receptor subunit TctC